MLQVVSNLGCSVLPKHVYGATGSRHSFRPQCLRRAKLSRPESLTGEVNSGEVVPPQGPMIAHGERAVLFSTGYSRCCGWCTVGRSARSAPTISNVQSAVSAMVQSGILNGIFEALARIYSHEVVSRSAAPLRLQKQTSRRASSASIPQTLENRTALCLASELSASSRAL